MLITINDLQLALGLSWAQLSGAAELRIEKKRAKSAYGATLQRSSQFWYGVYEGQTKGASYAGALAVGLVASDVVICEKISDDKAWACVLMDGAPVVGYDKIVDLKSARSIATEWLSMFGDHEIIGDLPGSKMSLSDLLEKLGEDLAHDKALKKKLNGFKLSKGESALAKSLALAALLCLPVFGMVGYQKWQDYKASQLSVLSTKERAQRDLLSAAEIKEQKRVSALKFQQDVAAKRLEIAMEAAESAEPVWNAWRLVLTRIPLSLHNYVPQNLDCDTGTCKLSWQGQGAFARPIEKAALPGVMPDVEPTLMANSEFKFELAPLPKENKQAEFLKRFNGPDEIRMAMVSDLMGIPGLNFTPPQPVVVPAPDGVELPPATIGYRGQWKVVLNATTGRLDMWQLQEQMKKWPMKSTKLSVASLSQSATFTVEGTYVLPLGFNR